jgi:predicted alpha/beta hydrolase family esterase
MKNAIILHGKPSKERFYDPTFPSTSNYYWLPWLQKQLVMNDIPTATPEVPNNWVADYVVWKKEFERYEITPETILIGHSCGGGFILRWLSEHPDVNVAKVVLAAPWLDPQRLENTGGFFDFTLDKSLTSRTKLSVLYSNDDEASILETASILRDTFPDASFEELQGYGHFYDDRRMEFPELLTEVLKG